MPFYASQESVLADLLAFATFRICVTGRGRSKTRNVRAVKHKLFHGIGASACAIDCTEDRLCGLRPLGCPASAGMLVERLGSDRAGPSSTFGPVASKERSLGDPLGRVWSRDDFESVPEIPPLTISHR